MAREDAPKRSLLRGNDSSVKGDLGWGFLVAVAAEYAVRSLHILERQSLFRAVVASPATWKSGPFPAPIAAFAVGFLPSGFFTKTGFLGLLSVCFFQAQQL
jgi:vacuolar-type H+-ATPase subunit I/STV1